MVNASPNINIDRKGEERERDRTEKGMMPRITSIYNGYKWMDGWMDR